METTRARGETAVYEAGGDRLVMSGGVQVADAESTLAADRVEVERGTGDATATGAVKVMYEAGDGSKAEPVHVVAAKAVSKKGTGVTEFTGGPVRMWQGGSQVEARVMDFDQAKKTMVAKGGGVKAVLAGAAKGGVVRVSGGEMTYADAARLIELKGGVTVVGVSGTMRADGATVTLAPATAQGGKKTVAAGTDGGLNLGGKVERMVGVGSVEVVQPGRRATGERLVYTAVDETFVLTGTKAVPPRMVDEERGTISGASLTFRSGDDSVVVKGGDGGRVTTETKLKQ